MRRAQVVFLGLLALSLGSCVNDRPARSTSLIDRMRGIGGPSGPDAVVIEYYLVERPAGDAAMNRHIWKQIDELVIPSETRALLGENGLRCGVSGALLPSELEAMIQNPRGPYGKGRERRLYVNNPASIAVAGPVALAEFQVRPSLEGSESAVRFENAKFSMNFVPSHGGTGRVILKCTPELEFNDRRKWLPTGAAGDAWAGQKPVERYENLSFEVNLSPRDFLVIGADFDRGKWLGNQMFADFAGNDKVQRLLIIRADHLSAASSPAPLSKNSPQDSVVPLARQAEFSAARGTRP